MGQMRFTVDPPDRLTEDRAAAAFLAGIDRVPWRTRVSVEQGVGAAGGPGSDARGGAKQLVLERPISDSGCLNLPWPVEPFGELMLATSSLRERDEPYLLPLELARGTLYRAREQLADWRAARLAVPAAVEKAFEGARHTFAQAAVSQQDRTRCGAVAEQSIRQTLEAAQTLVAAYVEQSITIRRRGGGRLSSLLGVDLGENLLDEAVGSAVLRGFNMACVPLRWRAVEGVEGTRRFAVPDRQIQWCRRHGLKCFAGPLLRFHPAALPDWLALWEGDVENVVDCLTEFIETIIRRYRGKVDAWVAAAQIATGDVLGLGEQEKLNITARVLELLQRGDPGCPRLIAFDEPWADYMGRRDADLPPLHMADALLRAGLDISGIVLEINVGRPPAAQWPRPAFETGRLLDLWSGLGVPIYVSISAPSDPVPDPRARRGTAAPPPSGIATSPGRWSPRAQQAWAAHHVPLMLAKPNVKGVVWNRLLDSAPGESQPVGLFDEASKPKPALRTLAALRRTHLK